MKLENDVIEQVRQVFASLVHKYTIRVSCDTASEQGRETVEFYTDFSAASPNISLALEATKVTLK